MKKILILLITILLYSSCDDFQEINTDPNVGIPPAEFLFTKVLKDLHLYKSGGEWYHENHQKMTWAEYLVQGESNFGDVNTILPANKYSTFYVTIQNHLDEMRLLISTSTEEKQKAYQKMNGAGDVIQAFFALKITDQFGDVPYSESGKGRHEDIVNPVYDKQEDILNALVLELNDAIQKLSENLVEEFDFSNNDFIYHGDATKWIKFANAIKLRIATRLLTQNEGKAKEIIASVVSDGRLFESDDDQFTWDIGGTYRGGGGAGIDWKGFLWAAKPMVEFMKTTSDPRIRIFYEANGYTQESIDAFASPSDISPAVDIANDNKVLYTTEDGEAILGYRYIGAPTHRQDPTVGVILPNGGRYYDYIYNDAKKVGPNTVMVSNFHKRLLQQCTDTYTGLLPPATGNYVDVMLSYAEVCFMMSEFILKGFTAGDAQAWYNSGVKSSLTTYNMIGEKQDLSFAVASKVYPYLSISNAEILNYLDTPEIKFNGADDLEKVHIQQFLNFFRLPSEGWILSMRTGYPKYGSSLLARFPIDNNELPFPRRIPAPAPNDLNLANWQSAMDAQGFSGRDEQPSTLNRERLWWDKNNPIIGSGGN